jgi:hypothetical protein
MRNDNKYAGSGQVYCLNDTLLTYLLHGAASQQIPRIYGTPKFITVLTSARHMSLPWARSIQSPHPLPLTEDPS